VVAAHRLAVVDAAGGARRGRADAPRRRRGNADDGVGRSAGTSVTTALVDTSSQVSNDSLLLAVLSGSPDDAVSRYEGGTE
jgi:hypothetical protein